MHSNAKKPRFCGNLPRHFTPPILFRNHGRSSSFAQVVRYSHLNSQVTIWYGNQEQQERQKTETWPSQKINSMDKIQDCVLFPFLKWGSPVPPSVAALTGSWAEAFGYTETGSLGPHQNWLRLSAKVFCKILCQETASLSTQMHSRQPPTFRSACGFWLPDIKCSAMQTTLQLAVATRKSLDNHLLLAIRSWLWNPDFIWTAQASKSQIQQHEWAMILEKFPITDHLNQWKKSSWLQSQKF